MHLTDFKFMITSLAGGDRDKMPDLAREARELIIELSQPRDIKHSLEQIARRRAAVVEFADKWGVTTLWAGDLVDAYDALCQTDQESAHSWLSQVVAQSSLPQPRPVAQDVLRPA